MDPPRLAVTTALLHERASHGLEVLLVRRPSTMAAFGDMWVFPGGQVDPADGAATAHAVLGTRGETHAATPFLAPHPSCPDPARVPLYAAACRELFEEVGVLLTAAAAPTEEALLAALIARRADILADGERFYAELAARGQRLDVARLQPWSRWITPPARTRRFDTIFFVTAVTSRAIVPDPREVADAHWLGVDDAIREGLAGSRRLMAPTILTLMQIAAAHRHFGSVTALLAAPCAQLIAPVHPRGIDLQGRHWIVFPWDGCGPEAGRGWRTSHIAQAVPGRLCAEF